MLTSLVFKNWRSLRDITIPYLTPLTVFVGENAAGKSNILDGLHFLRYARRYGVVEAVHAWGGYARIHTLGVSLSEETELGFSFIDLKSGKEFLYTLQLKFDDQTPATFWFQEELEHDGKLYHRTTTTGKVYMNDPAGPNVTTSYNHQHATPPSDLPRGLHERLFRFVRSRWQLLDEVIALPKFTAAEEIEILERDIRNLPAILMFMRDSETALFEQLQRNLQIFFPQLEMVKATETWIRLYEREAGGSIAPTISSGQAQMIALLTALYMLEMEPETAELPGLAALEQPAIALHPSMVDLLAVILRDIVGGTLPRQILLTTQNPRLLNFFYPEELRLVSRDAVGDTRVSILEPKVAQRWLDAGFGLGDAWMAHSLGDFAMTKKEQH